MLRLFPAQTDGTSSFTLYEDDGLSLAYRKEEFAEVAFDLSTTHDSIALSATKTGRYGLPYTRIRVVLPEREHRRIALDGNGVELTVED